jgi:hypothetical protein
MKNAGLLKSAGALPMNADEMGNGQTGTEIV